LNPYYVALIRSGDCTSAAAPCSHADYDAKDNYETARAGRSRFHGTISNEQRANGIADGRWTA